MKNFHTLSEQGRVSLSPEAQQFLHPDDRLLLAASLYPCCETGADIGTDHGHLPALLLLTGQCRRMIFADVSDKALAHARDTVDRLSLQDRARLVCADGLDAVQEACGCVSIMGMGGETMAEILRRGQDRLQGAALVLSAHTEQHLVRQAIHDIGYHIAQEKLCRAEGRFYLFWQAMPGAEAVTGDAIRYGRLMYQETTPLLREYLAWRIQYLTGRLTGLRSAAQADPSAIAQVEKDLRWYQTRMEETSC